MSNQTKVVFACVVFCVTLIFDHAVIVPAQLQLVRQERVHAQGDVLHYLELLRTYDGHYAYPGALWFDEFFRKEKIIELTGLSKQEIDGLLQAMWQRVASRCAVEVQKAARDDYYSSGADARDCLESLRKVGRAAPALERDLAKARAKNYTREALYQLGQFTKAVEEAKKFGGRLTPEQVQEVQRLLDSLR